MFISPIYVFIFPWLVGISVSFFLAQNSPIFSPVSFLGIFSVLYLLIILFLFNFFFTSYLSKPLDTENLLKEKLNLNALKNLLVLIFYSHLAYFSLAILYSNGFPLLWVIIGSENNYTNFGIPSITGFFNMLRSFGLVSCLLLIFYGDNSQKKYVILISLYFLISSFFLEASRGNGLIMLLHPIGMYLLLRKINIKEILFSIVLIIFFIFFFGFLQALRYSDFNLETLANASEAIGLENANEIFVFLAPFLIYIATPIMNMDLNLSKAPNFSFSLDNSLISLLPTGLRDYLSGGMGEKFGMLIDDAYNTTSFLTPLIMDFGSIGGLFIASFLLILTSWIYSKAKEGNLFYILIWPPFFMSLILSSFNSYFFSLVVITYPLMIILFLKFLLKPKYQFL
tara:strand:+ start:84 stop:1274 length:1191 start_codon:yes stop_codon:yes gene_type:complete